MFTDFAAVYFQQQNVTASPASTLEGGGHNNK